VTSVTADALAAFAPPAEGFLGRDDTCAAHRYLGTHRHRGLGETLRLAWAERAASGISRVADITDLDQLGIPVFNTYRPDAEPGNLTVSCGKGMTREAALVSALMEGIERHSGEQHGRRGEVCGYADSVRATPTLNPRDLVLDIGARWDENQPTE
jgi:YcaO-like protein with predicted kinase domain